MPLSKAINDMEVVMIEDVEGYKSYLRDVRGLVEGTVNSYPTYLSAITNHLHIDITADSVYSSESVKDILRRLKASLKAKKLLGKLPVCIESLFRVLGVQNPSSIAIEFE